MAIDYQIRELEKQLDLHRCAAIQYNEPPGGYNRKRAEYLELKLDRLRRKQLARQHPHYAFHRVLALVAIVGAALFSLREASLVLNQLKTWASASRPENSSPSSAKTVVTRPGQNISNPDPALAMQGRFHGSKLGGARTALDAGFGNYQRLTGTLARIQAVAFKNRSAARQLPSVWINRTREDCFDRSSIGVYSPKCQVIKLDYTDGYTTYEHPVEMEVTLAHEWGHHLISLSGVAMSPTEQEVVSDCFAGAVFGYYARNNLITLDEATRAINMVAYVGNNSPYGHHPNRETRLRSFAGGLASVYDPSHPSAAELMASCPSLNQIVDVNKIRGMGLSWKP